jgi:AraC-like DNA-binding protein
MTGIANAVGYTSEFAFSRAFRRHRGMPPSRYRQLAGTAPGMTGGRDHPAEPTRAA